NPPVRPSTWRKPVAAGRLTILVLLGVRSAFSACDPARIFAGCSCCLTLLQSRRNVTRLLHLCTNEVASETSLVLRCGNRRVTRFWNAGRGASTETGAG